MDGQLSCCVQFSSSSSPSPASPSSASSACQRSFFFFYFLVFSDFLLVKMRIERVYFEGGPHMISFHNFMPRNVCSMSGIMLELC